VSGYAEAIGAETAGAPGVITLRNIQDIPAPNSITGSKLWIDNSNAYDSRPDSIHAALYADGILLDEQAFTEDAAVPGNENTWAITFEGSFPLYKEVTDSEGVRTGYEAIAYSIAETDGSGNIIGTLGAKNGDSYKVAADSEAPLTVTNELAGTLDLTAIKEWSGDDGHPETRPDSVEIELLKGDTAVGSATLYNGNGSVTFEGLDKYENGVKITYTVRDNAPGYAYSFDADTNTLANTYTGLDVTVHKQWLDDGAEDTVNARGAIEVSLIGGVDTYTATLNKNNGWSHTFRNLDRTMTVTNERRGDPVLDDEGNPVLDDETGEPLYETLYEDDDVQLTYTVTEDSAPKGYEIVVGAAGEKEDYTLVNRRAETADVTVTKTWVDDGKTARPDSATFTLEKLENGKWVYADEKTVPTTDGTVTFKDVPKFDENGILVSYRVTETLPDGPPYSADAPAKTIDEHYGAAFTNTLSQNIETSFTFAKSWVAPAGVTPPDTISVQLYRDGEAYGAPTAATLNEHGQYTFTGLPKYRDGSYAAHAYTVRELDENGDAVENGGSIVLGGSTYAVAYNRDGNGITNRMPVTETALTINKYWLNPAGTVHPAAAFTVYRRVNGAAGVPYGDKVYTNGGSESADLTEQVTVPNLPLSNEDFSETYAYYAEESPLDGYTPVQQPGNTDENAFFNRVNPADVTISGEKTWIDVEEDEAGAVPAEILIGLYSADAATGAPKLLETQAASEPDWSYSFTVEGGRYASDGQYVRYFVRELAEDEDGALMPLASRDRTAYGGHSFEAGYDEPSVNGDGNTETGVTNTLLTRYYYNVIVYYRTVTDSPDGEPAYLFGSGEWTAVSKYLLEKGEKDAAVTLADVVGESAVGVTLAGWETWNGNSGYALIDSIPQVRLLNPGKDAAPDIQYWYQRTVTTEIIKEEIVEEDPVVEEEIPDENTPGDPAPADNAPQDGDGISAAGAHDSTDTIPEEAVPMASATDPENSHDPELIILDDGVPLADLPQTGATAPAAGPAGPSFSILPDPLKEEEDEE
jgi:hypothetical protein